MTFFPLGLPPFLPLALEEFALAGEVREPRADMTALMMSVVFISERNT